MHGSQHRFAACLAIALFVHAALFAWASGEERPDAAVPLHVTRAAGATATAAPNATHAVQDQHGNGDRSSRTRAGASMSSMRGETGPTAPAPITRFVVVAEPAAPKPVATNDNAAPLDPDPRTPQAEQVRSASRDARAAYLAAWQQRIEARGSRNYPVDLLADGGTRRLTMAVRLGADGRLLAVRILNSSGSTALDQAAADIVRDAAPFPAFDPAMTADDDELSFAYDWLFETGADTHLEPAG